MPTTFSIALPAIATTTRPANASDRCRVWMVGCSAVTNQSETSAAAALARVSRVTASHTGQRGPSCADSPGAEAAPDPPGAEAAAPDPLGAALDWPAAGSPDPPGAAAAREPEPSSGWR